MIETMFDSISATSIPASAPSCAGYIDGNPYWRSYFGEVARFPGRPIISITTGQTLGARVLDCENGDSTPTQAAMWCLLETQSARRPTVYTNLAEIGDVQSELRKLGLSIPGDVDWWKADWGVSPSLGAFEGYPEAVAHQYAAGDVYDTSIALSTWLQPVPPKPVPPPRVVPPTSTVTPVIGGKEMLAFVEFDSDADGNACVLFCGKEQGEAGITSVEPAIPFGQWTGAATPLGSNPPVDKGYWNVTAHVQERNGFVLVSTTNAQPHQRVGVYVGYNP